VRTWLRKATAALTMIVVLTVFGGVVSAHHGRAGYTEDGTVTGIVTSMTWRNPHTFVNFDVKGEAGNIVHWVGELSSPQTMMAAGVSRNTLKPGDEITVGGRTGGVGEAPVLLVRWITRDGASVIGDPDSDESFTSNTR
jgi:hypothetical protein